MFGAHPSVLGQNCISFVSKASLETVGGYNLRKRVEAVKNVRNIGKMDMKHNAYIPEISVDPETYVVTVDGVDLKMGPCDTVPMSQSVFLF